MNANNQRNTNGGHLGILPPPDRLSNDVFDLKCRRYKIESDWDWRIKKESKAEKFFATIIFIATIILFIFGSQVLFH
jgi:hypothetical protein